MTSEQDLPGLPDHRAVNVHYQGANNNSAERFDSLYRHRYGSLPGYEDARTVFTNRTLMRGKVEAGVNTFHEQVLAGRLSLDDIQTMGYGNLARLDKDTRVQVLRRLTDPRPRILSAAEVKSAFTLSKTSLMLYAIQRGTTDWRAQLGYVLDFIAHLGVELAREVRNHEGVLGLGGLYLTRLAARDPEKTPVTVRYIESFINALRDELPDVLPSTFYGQNLMPVRYWGRDFEKLMDHGISPERAARFMLQGLSVERAVTAKNIPGAISEGTL